MNPGPVFAAAVLIAESLERGLQNIADPRIIEYTKNGKTLKVITGSDTDKLGKIITVSFG